MPAGAVGVTVCQVPIVVMFADGDSRIEVEYADGRIRRESGWRLDGADSAEIFGRTGVVRAVRVTIGDR